MKATGIVRRIDDLGRVVIPKEIRRTMRIREGDPLEIYTDREGGVIFKKYSPMGDMSEIADSLCESFGKIAGKPCIICDRDNITASFGAKELLERPISGDLSKAMEKRSMYQSAPGTIIYPCEDVAYKVAVAAPIIANGDISGCVVFIQDDKSPACEADGKLATAAAGFLAKQMES